MDLSSCSGVQKSSLVKKIGCRENGETRNGVGQVVFDISMEKLHTIR